jgi:hypothetical protein
MKNPGNGVGYEGFPVLASNKKHGQNDSNSNRGK